MKRGKKEGERSLLNSDTTAVQETERSGRRPLIGPNAMIIRPLDKSKYVEILGRIKKEKSTRGSSGCVDRICKTATGEMLIVLAKGSKATN